MSALGSAVINKSSRKFAPKAQVRRTVQPSSTQVSARPGVDGHIQSQTPQPRPPSNAATSPLPSIPFPSPVSTQPPSTGLHESSSQDVGAIRIPVPSRHTESAAQTSPSPAVLHEQSSHTQRDPVPSSSSQSPRNGHAPRTSNEPIASDLIRSTSSEAAHQSPQPSASSQPSDPSRDANAPPPIVASSTGTNAPNAKRRKVDHLQNSRRILVDHSQNVPVPSTETSGDAAETSGTATSLDQKTKITKKYAPKTIKQRNEKPVASFGTAAIPELNLGKKKFRSRAKSAEIAVHDEPEASSEPCDITRDPESHGHALAIGRARKPRQSAKSKKKKALQDAAAEIVADAVQTSSKEPKKRGRKSRRAITPEGAEDIEIAPSEVKMMDLCTDNGNGKKSEREIWLREYERAEFVKAKQRELQAVMGHVDSADQINSTAAENSRLGRKDSQQEQEEEVFLNVPNTIIVNGQIQIDETSLQIDRHAAAAAERDLDEPSIVEENPYTRKVNSGTWLRRDKSGGWNELLVDRFYEGLRMFGTDFEMISKMFPGKTRHSVKLKFCKEEKRDYPRITAALSGERVGVDLGKYQRMTGIEYGDPEDLEREIASDKLRLEEEQNAEKDAMEAAVREREEQIAAERATAAEDLSNENGDREKRKKGAQDGKGRKRHGEVPGTKAREIHADHAGNVP